MTHYSPDGRKCGRLAAALLGGHDGFGWDACCRLASNEKFHSLPISKQNHDGRAGRWNLLMFIFLFLINYLWLIYYFRLNSICFYHTRRNAPIRDVGCTTLPTPELPDSILSSSECTKCSVYKLIKSYEYFPSYLPKKYDGWFKFIYTTRSALCINMESGNSGVGSAFRVGIRVLRSKCTMY